MEGEESGEVRKKIEEEDLLELADVLRRKMADNKGAFSEIISIRPNGQLSLEDEVGLKSIFAHHASVEANGGAEGLYTLAFKVQGNAPDLKFAFERDPEGGSVKYTVQEKPVGQPAGTSDGQA